MRQAFQYATGADLDVASMGARHGKHVFRAASFGLTSQGRPINNTFAINLAIRKAAAAPGGGTVVIPEGIYPVYTIVLASHVTLHLEKNAILRAARPDPSLARGTRGHGENGNVLPPEANPMAGPQDGGHSHFANSLIYGHDLEDIAVTGEGALESFLDGSSLHEKGRTGPTEYILRTDDPASGRDRARPGHCGTWFGNKGVALVRCRDVFLADFGVLIGGHFAFMLEGCRNACVFRVVLDTARDAFDIDSCQDVTVKDSWFNSPNDDALCMKASFGAGEWIPERNLLLSDCTVSGFDAGSVFDGSFSTDRQIALDRCGPTGRVKFGTEASCGLDTVIIRNIRFLRSRGLCLETCDCAKMHDILAENLEMDSVSGAPIFIRVGDRGRFPVTGYHRDSMLTHAEDIRLTDPQWCIPNTEGYPRYPAVRYQAAIRRDFAVSTDGRAEIRIPDPGEPCLVNPKNFGSVNGKTCLKRWNEKTGSYEPDPAEEIPEEDRVLFANGVGGPMAEAWNIVIRNVTARDIDPRYPILLHGLTDSRIRDIRLENIDLEFRGGMTQKMAVEQRQQNTGHRFSMRGTKPLAQLLPWQVNTFFAKGEALLPRADYDPGRKVWKNDMYNVPEKPAVYPEPSNWGILPAFGLYARHVEGLEVKSLTVRTAVPDTRKAVVLDDVRGAALDTILVQNGKQKNAVVLVRDPWRRKTGQEMVPNAPYHEETVTDFSLTHADLLTERVTISAPAPGTPPDLAFPFATVPVPENGYLYPEKTEDLPLPLTVFPPYALWKEPPKKEAGIPLSGRFFLVDPAGEAMPEDTIESSAFPEKNPVVPTRKRSLSCSGLLLAGKKTIPVLLTREGENSFLAGTKEPIPAADTILLKLFVDDGKYRSSCFLPVRVRLCPGTKEQRREKNENN